MPPLTAPEDVPEEVIVLFDVVIASYRFDKMIKDPKQLIISATIDSKTVDITSSRINVTEFKPSSTFEMLTSLRELRRNVQHRGVFIRVMLEDNLVGIGTLKFPRYVSNRICEDMNDVIHSGVVKMHRQGHEVGQVELLCRLTMKCGEIPA